jgi:hypothetical protein
MDRDRSQGGGRRNSASVSKPELVTIALSELGGAQRPVDTEEIAVKAHELAPTAFSWRLFPELINLELVRVALVDASRPRSGSTVRGKGRGGWMLTDGGVAWILEHGSRVLGALGQSPSLGTSPVKQPETQHHERERIRLMRTAAWRKWVDGLSVSAMEAAQVFRVDQYTTTNNKLAKTRTLIQLFSHDSVIDSFLREMLQAMATTEHTNPSSEGVPQ